MDPRARRTRRLLVDGLKALLLERSYGRITVGDIATQATVNRATVYLHFRDKDALLQVLLGEHVREGLDRSAPVPSSREAGYLPVLLTAVFPFSFFFGLPGGRSVDPSPIALLVLDLCLRPSSFSQSALRVERSSRSHLAPASCPSKTLPSPRLVEATLAGNRWPLHRRPSATGRD